MTTSAWSAPERDYARSEAPPMPELPEEPDAEAMWMIGPDGERARYVTTVAASQRLGFLTPRRVQIACRAWWTRVQSELARARLGGAPPNYQAGPHELRCVRLGGTARGLFYVREDTLGDLRYKSPDQRGKTWGRVAGTPSTTYRQRPPRTTVPLASAEASAEASEGASEAPREERSETPAQEGPQTTHHVTAHVVLRQEP